jgi:hypothetical protein
MIDTSRRSGAIAPNWISGRERAAGGTLRFRAQPSTVCYHDVAPVYWTKPVAQWFPRRFEKEPSMIRPAMSQLISLFYLYFVFYGSITSAAEAVFQPKTRRSPNVIVVLADDLGGSDLACFGSDLHETELYNLAEDPGEEQDLSAAQPQRTESMLKQLQKWQFDVGAQIPARRG